MNFSTLSPDLVLDALESIGLYSDGRLLALNSYENRVYQVGIEDGPPLIAKFYRPERWSDAAILEEHAFVSELVAEEIPVVPALAVRAPATLYTHEGFRFAVFTRHGGRAPELDDPKTLEWLGRFIGRIHAVGQQRPFEHRPALDITTFGHEPFAWLLDHNFIPPDLLASYRTTVEHALAGVARSFARAGDVRQLRLHGDCQSDIGCQLLIVLMQSPLQACSKLCVQQFCACQSNALTLH